MLPDSLFNVSFMLARRIIGHRLHQCTVHQCIASSHVCPLSTRAFINESEWKFELAETVCRVVYSSSIL
jgi:hypothetical protein